MNECSLADSYVNVLMITWAERLAGRNISTKPIFRRQGRGGREEGCPGQRKKHLTKNLPRETKKFYLKAKGLSVVKGMLVK